MKHLLQKVRKALLPILCLACCIPTWASAQTEQKISISVKNMPLREFLSSVEKKCSYTFFYSTSVLTNARNVTIEAHNQTVPEILTKVFAGTDRTFEIVGDKIAIKLNKNTAQNPSDDTGQTATNLSEGNADTPVKAAEVPHVVTGTVIDEKGQPMGGVGVLVVGTLQGVVSNSNGTYSIKATPSQELHFSFLGYKEQNIKVGSRTEINISMVDNAQALESVVVTALGMKREEKSLGYAATKVSNDRFLNSSASSNWVGGLTGQVAGLAIDRSNSGPGGSMRVTLRGESSVDLSNNSALFVVDGVPMYNNSTASTAGGDDTSFAIDYGDGTGDVNPDDIESVTILKGPAATALYGSNAANGAIIITTKSGDRQESSLDVSYSMNILFETVSTSPDLQYEYGQGASADYYYYMRGTDANLGLGYNPVPSYKNNISLESWGPRMDGSLQYQYYDASRSIGGAYDKNGDFIRSASPFVSQGDWFKNYFNTGYTLTNTVSLSGKINKNNSVRVTMSDYRNEGIVPNTPNNKQFMSFRSKSNITKWLTAESSLNYRRQHSDNIPTSSGYGSTAIMYGLWSYAPNVNMNWAQNYWLEGQENLAQDTSLSGGKNNAYFLANECLNTMARDRVYGNVKFDITLMSGLTLMLRGGIDSNIDFRTQRQATSTQANPDGFYREQNINSMQYTGDFLLKYDRRLGTDFNITANLGGSLLNQNYRSHTQTADKLKQPGVYTLVNSLGEIKTDNYGYTRQTNALYGLVSVSWRNAVFLDVTGRNDWSSTLPAGNNSYFYPSVSGSVAVNDLFNFGKTSGLINLLKVRASWAQVGHDTSPYRISDYLASTKFPGGSQIPTSKANSDLKPEIVSSWEVGVDLRMFRNRLNLDIAYYDGKSKNLIANMPVSYSTGASNVYTNAGTIRNYGIEITALGTIIQTKDVQWKIGANWSQNRNEVLSLGDGIDSWVVASYSSHAYMIAYKGSSLTAMYGKGYKRAPEGSYVVDNQGVMQDVSGQIVMDKQGKPMMSEDLEYIGECSPKWRGGFNTSVKWKNLLVSVSFDGQFGGNVFSYTNWLLNYRGKGTSTLTGREGGFIAPGVVQLNDGNYKVNDYAIPRGDISEYYHSAYSNTNAEANFTSTQFLKLREVRLEYSLPKKVLAKTKFIKGLSLAVFGNNLFCWSKFPGWDPEGVSMRGSAITPGFEIMQMPSGAQYGGSVKITF